MKTFFRKALLVVGITFLFGGVMSAQSKSKTLVVYYSASGRTEAVAKTLANYFDADIFEVESAPIYSSADLDWTDKSSRVCKEYANEKLRDVKLVSTKVTNWASYDTVLIGYPIWWGIAAWPLTTFVKANNFAGKTVIPFCTAISSGLGNSGRLLAQEAKIGNWQTGKRFSSYVSASEVESWAKGLNIK